MKSVSKRYAVCFSLLADLLLILFTLSLFFGSIRVSAAEFLQIILGNGNNVTAASIIKGIRLPRALAAALLGGALSVSGFLLQTFFNNPIAGPFVLGISSGAKMTVAFAMIIFLGAGKAMSSAALITAAFAGSMLSLGFVLLISVRVKKKLAAYSKRRDDRIYMLGNYGFCSYICKRQQHCKFAQLVNGQLFGY